MIRKPDFFEHLCRGERIRGYLFDERDILVNRKGRDEIIELEHEADFLRSVIGKLIV